MNNLPINTSSAPLYVSWARTMLHQISCGEDYNWAYAMVKVYLEQKTPKDLTLYVYPKPRYLYWKLEKSWGGKQWQLKYKNQKSYELVATVNIKKDSEGLFSGSVYVRAFAKSFNGPNGPKLRQEILDYCITNRLAVSWSNKPWNPTND